MEAIYVVTKDQVLLAGKEVVLSDKDRSIKHSFRLKITLEKGRPDASARLPSLNWMSSDVTK